MGESEKILLEIKKGGKNVYKIFFYTYYTDLVYFATSIIHNTYVAEDLIQDFFIEFWRTKKYNDIETSLSSFLFRSVRNRCLNHIRDEERKSKRLNDYCVEQLFDNNDYEENLEIKEILYKTINKLPEQTKRVFTLCCIHGLKYKDVADDLDISINTVRTHMSRAFKFLRGNLSSKSFSSLMFFITKYI